MKHTIATIALAAFAAIAAATALAETRYNLPTHEQVDDIARAVYTEAATAATNHLELAYDRIAQLGGVRVTNAAERTLAALPDAIYTVTNTDRFAKFLNAPGVLTDASGAVTNLRAYAFYNCDSLHSISLPNCKTVGERAFCGCLALASVDLPNVTVINNETFRGCKSLVSVNLPNVTRVEYQNAFALDSSLKKISLPSAVYVGSGAFTGCSSLAEVSLPVVEELGNGAISQGPIVEHLSFPRLRKMGGYVFQELRTLQTLVLGSPEYPNFYSHGDEPFRVTTSLRRVELYGVDNSNSIWFRSGAGDAMEEFVTPLMSTSNVLARPNWLLNLSHSCVWTCSDGTIEWVDGAWTAIPFN